MVPLVVDRKIPLPSKEMPCQQKCEIQCHYIKKMGVKQLDSTKTSNKGLVIVSANCIVCGCAIFRSYHKNNTCKKELLKS